MSPELGLHTIVKRGSCGFAYLNDLQIYSVQKLNFKVASQQSNYYVA